MKKHLFIVLILTVFVTVNCSSKKNIISYPKEEIIKIEESDSLTNEDKTIGYFFKSTSQENKWVDSLFNQLSLDEKIGQLFMVAAYSNKDAEHVKSVEKLVVDQKVGGLIFFQGGPVRQAKLTNYYQSKAKTPLFIGIDAEWGLSMRLDSTYRYPWNMTLGAIQDLKLIEKTGEQMAHQSKRMGIHFNFSPVIDINTNPKNPIIGNRSFGENKFNVTERALALMNGLQKHGVFATGKHFPGHGATETDSHYTLPIINFTKEHIKDVELYPYKNLINRGLASVMVAHLSVPSFDDRKGYPSSISYNIVTDLLQKELGFNGLIFTDALNMKGASNFKKPGEIDLEALLAGNDILLFPEDVPVAVEKIKEALVSSKLTKERLELSVKKILHFKYKSGLNKLNPIVLENLYNDLNKSTNDALQYKLYENAITVIKNQSDILPIKDLEKEKIAYVKLGDDFNTDYIETLKKYGEVTEVFSANLDTLNTLLSNYTKVIIGFHKADGAWRKNDFNATEIEIISSIAKQRKVILNIFTKPYSLLSMPNLDNIDGIVISYQNNKIAQIVSAQVIFGAIQAKGKLPISINDQFVVNQGINTIKLNRLGFTTPENVGMNSLTLNRVDEIITKAINEQMTPSGQVLIARYGKVIYQKSFGFHTYKKEVKVKNSDIYDVASITKIVSTLPNVMKLYDTKKVTLDTKLGDMLPVFKNTNKENILFKDLLTHSAGLDAWIPFYLETLDENNKPSEKYYRKTYSDEYNKQVAENIYIKESYRDSIINKIINSSVSDKKEYKYSDFTFSILKEFVEKYTGKSLDLVSNENFYNSLGANYTLFNPLRKFDMSVIPPTEVDNYFRHQTVQGYVHDMAAAMEGGVGGHAGIFSNSMDLAKIMQMYLQKGNYGNKQYITEKTFDIFNTCFYCDKGNRRGIGFDKPQISNSGPTCGCASMTSFGHTGFTGTMAWADPEKEIVYIFLSNRTFPDYNSGNMLSKNNIRENIQQVIYDAIVE